MYTCIKYGYLILSHNGSKCITTMKIKNLVQYITFQAQYR